MLKNEAFRPIVCIVQARMSSTRLPGKVMKEICGRPILWHLTNRLKASRFIDKIVIATSTDESDGVIAGWCEKEGIECFRGSLNDVLDRYYRAARKYTAKTVVRITADCPLIDPQVVDRVIGRFMEGGYDRAGTVESYPDGLDTEVLSFDALDVAWREARLASEREHVSTYIWMNPRRFRLCSVECEKELGHMRWTVDDEKDFLLVKKIFEGMGGCARVFGMDEILRFLEANPELLKINAATKRNEGYAKSLREDRLLPPREPDKASA